MSLAQLIGRHRTRALLTGSALLLCGTAVFPAGASAAGSVSANWAGYVALPTAAGKRFSSVSGSWTQPRVSCTVGRQSYSAVWVGLGGFREDSRALEQIGSEADCSRGGRAVYSAWYELIPAGPVSLKVRVSPGDEMVASVTVRGHYVTLRLRDVTSGAHYAITRPIRTIDASSAEWIVEAPSSCSTASSCRTLALSDFGTVSFLNDTATLGGHVGGVSDARWSDVELEMRQSELAGGPTGPRDAQARAGGAIIAATPSALSSPLGAFTVNWQEEQPQSQESAPRPFPGVAD